MFVLGIKAALQCVSMSGKVICYMAPGSDLPLDASLMRGNVSVCVPRAIDAVTSFLAKSDEDQQALLYTMTHGIIPAVGAISQVEG